MIILVCVEFICFSSCTTQDPIKKEFNKSLNILNSFLLDLLEVPVEEIKITENGSAKIFNYEKQQESIEKRKKDWLALKNALNKFIMSNSQSKWADDALFCLNLVLERICFFKPNQYVEENIEIVLKLTSYQDIKIENITKKALKDSYWKGFNILKNSLHIVNEDELIQYLSVMNVVNQLKFLKKYDRAINLLEILLEKCADNEISEIIMKEIEFCKDLKKGKFKDIMKDIDKMSGGRS
jgi:hypothetical protein